jgi:5-methylcytosine-specific restriction endonuclease McrA
VVFGKLRPEVFWGMAHWLGRKYKIDMPEVMEKYRDGDTITYKSVKLAMPTEYKAKRFVARTWHNPYTEPEQVREEKDRIKRESLLSYDRIWDGTETRQGWEDLREEVILLKGTTCYICGTELHPYEVEIDHSKPRSRFKDKTEADRMKHLQPLCTSCHRAKTKTDRKVLSRMP